LILNPSFTATMATKAKGDASLNPLSVSNINPHLLKVQYAVRGELAVKAEKYRDMLREHPNDHGLPFDRVISANIGNPQQKGLDQPPLTFGRQVRSRGGRVVVGDRDRWLTGQGRGF
jgi:hypothetical protein